MSGQYPSTNLDAWLSALFTHRHRSLASYTEAVEAVYPWGLPDATAVDYVTRTFQGAARLLARYDNTQLGHGLWYLVSSPAGTMHALLNDAVPWEARERCVRSFTGVFAGLFAPRCVPLLSHTGESGHSPLHLACYMWWDIFPFWGSLVGEPRFDDLFLDVMEATLALPSDPCREAALHGLGHIPAPRERAQAIIDVFLTAHRDLRAELRQYAEAARSGCIQ